jgi:hypothetical protein
MSQESSISREKPESWVEEIGLATYKDGFTLGGFPALILQLGIIKITTKLQEFIVFILLLLGIFVAIHKVYTNHPLINPPVDDFISGFGVVLGAITFIETYFPS